MGEAVDDPEALTLRAERRYDAGDCDGARRDLDRALRLDGLHVPALVIRSWILVHHDVKSALTDADRAIAIEPERPHGHFARARVLERMGDRTGSVDALRRALSRCRSDEEFRAYLQNEIRRLGGPEDPPCSRCGAPATACLTDIRQGGTQETRLCDDCARDAV